MPTFPVITTFFMFVLILQTLGSKIRSFPGRHCGLLPGPARVLAPGVRVRDQGEPSKMAPGMFGFSNPKFAELKQTRTTL